MGADGEIVSIRAKKKLWLVDGYLVPSAGEDAVVVLLTFEGRQIAQCVATPRRGGARRPFRFTLADTLACLLAPESGLAATCDGTIVPFSAQAEATRRSFAANPGALDDVRRKLDLGYRLARKGKLSAPLRDRFGLMPATIAHYRACDKALRTVAGYDIHVVGGTMLGLLREGGPIAHDMDFDGAYLSRLRDPASVKREFVTIVRALIERGEDVRVSRWERGRNFVKWRAPATQDAGPKAAIDLFPAYIDAEGFYCRPTFVRIPGGRKIVLPLARRRFDGVEVWAPARMEEKALLLFGEGWRIPDVSWRKPRLPGAEDALAPLRLSEAEIDELDRLRARLAPLRARIARRRKILTVLRRLAGRLRP